MPLSPTTSMLNAGSRVLNQTMNNAGAAAKSVLPVLDASREASPSPSGLSAFGFIPRSCVAATPAGGGPVATGVERNSAPCLSLIQAPADGLGPRLEVPVAQRSCTRGVRGESVAEAALPTPPSTDRSSAIRVADEARNMLGTCHWRRRIVTEVERDPVIYGRDGFARWLRGQVRTLRPHRFGPSMCCADVLYLAANRAGVLPKDAIVAIYEQAAAGDDGVFSNSLGFAQAERYVPTMTLKRGQIVYFDGCGGLDHVMLASGTENEVGEPLVISLHSPSIKGDEATPGRLSEVPLPYLQKRAGDFETTFVSEPQWESLAKETPKTTPEERWSGYGLSGLREPKKLLQRNLVEGVNGVAAWIYGAMERRIARALARSM